MYEQAEEFYDKHFLNWFDGCSECGVTKEDIITLMYDFAKRGSAISERPNMYY